MGDRGCKLLPGGEMGPTQGGYNGGVRELEGQCGGTREEFTRRAEGGERAGMVQGRN